MKKESPLAGGNGNGRGQGTLHSVTNSNPIIPPAPGQHNPETQRLLDQAAKYRRFAADFGPHLADLKKSYLDKATQLEAQAAALVGSPCEDRIPLPTPPNSKLSTEARPWAADLPRPGQQAADLGRVADLLGLSPNDRAGSPAPLPGVGLGTDLVTLSRLTVPNSPPLPQAAPVAVTPALVAPAPIIDPTAGPGSLLIELKPQARVHSRLAVTVLSDKRANIHRAFSIWLTARQGGRCWFYLDDLLEFYAGRTGQSERNIRRWIDAGEGIFFTWGSKGGRRVVTLLGKNRVFANYGLTKPGKVMLIETPALLGDLRPLRAALFACWVEKETKWASRQTIRGITTAAPRTQQNYDNVNQQRKQQTFCLDFLTEHGEARQLPNRYYRRHFTQGKPAESKPRHNLYTPDSKGATCDPGAALGHRSPSLNNPKEVGVKAGNKPRRILFDSAPAAVKAAVTRAKAGQTMGQVFSVLDYTKGGKILLKSFDIGLALGQ